MKIIVAAVLALFVTVRDGSGQVVVATIRSDVPQPSPAFTTYFEGELVHVSVPSNWRELPGSNAVTFAPEGAYGNAGVRSVFTHGFAMGLARNDHHDLRATTDGFIDAYVLVNPVVDRTFSYRPITVSDRPGLQATVSSVSNATGQIERIEVLTTLLSDGTLFYALAVSPRNCAVDYIATFRRIIASIEIRDHRIGLSTRK